MDRRFLRYYEEELRFVRDLAGEFAASHARVADRFGLEADSCADPYVEWLLDGFAFLAARVHLKLDGEHQQFTHQLLEMVYPDLLTPLPAAAIVRFEPDPTAAPLDDGHAITRGTRLVSRLAPGEQTRCTFTTAHDVTLWPLALSEARYVTGPALAGLGIGARERTAAALVMRIETMADMPVAQLALDRLPLHLAGNDRIAHRLYEALAAHGLGLIVRESGGQVAGRVPGKALRRIGFDDAEALYRPAPLGFSGYRLLHEYFTLPERFMFVEMSGLNPLLRRLPGTVAEIVVPLSRYDPVLDGTVTAAQLVPFATPALNLFARRAKPISLEAYARDHHVVPDRTRPLDYEVCAVTSVVGYGEDERVRHEFTPFYRTDHLSHASHNRAYYTLERRARLVTGGERMRAARRLAGGDQRRREAARSSYLGTDLFVALCDGNAAPWPEGLRRLDVETLCTNRDLPLRLPLGRDGTHFTSEQGGPVRTIRVVGRVTSPRESLAMADPADGGRYGQVSWRLVGHLALNYLSLIDSPEGAGADALRGLLALYASQAEPAQARHVDGVRSVRWERITRRLPLPGPITFGRGLEISLELVDAAFQEGGAFLLGSVLDVFFRRHVTLNSFTEMVLMTSERGELARFAAQPGERATA